jgi:ribosomal protein S18 acetylase RimI-like enzyme
MAEPAIREFSYPQDYPGVHRLWSEAGNGIHLGRSDTPAEIEKKLQRDPDLFLLAETDGQIVGAVIGGFDGRRGMMYHLAVAQAYRHLGVATQLVNELEKRLKAKGCLRYYLLVTKDNLDAIQYYENHGWERMELWPYAKDVGG